jgi:crossover junction endodeoxyribonuclease RuvC
VVILGIDPGIAETGYGIIETGGGDRSRLVAFGVVSTSPRVEHPLRLRKIYDEISGLIASHKPDAVAVEAIFHSRNLKSLVDVSEAIGVITLAASGLPVQKITPLKVKSAVVGVGRAQKEQVRLMIMNELELDEPPTPHHASDALAVAICYRNMNL